MPDEQLRIVIEAIDNATAQLKGLKGNLEKLGADGAEGGKGLSKTQNAISILKNIAGAYVVKEGIKLVKHITELGMEAERAEKLMDSLHKTR